MKVNMITMHNEYQDYETTKSFKTFPKSCVDTHEVSDEEAERMVEADYHIRVAEAIAAGEEPSSVERRDFFDIINELNRNEYNEWRRNDHHRDKWLRRDSEGELYNPIDEQGSNGYEYDLVVEKADDENIKSYVKTHLKPDQASLLIAIYWDGLKAVEIAQAEGKTESAISQRLKTAINNLKSVGGDKWVKMLGREKNKF